MAMNKTPTANLKVAACGLLLCITALLGLPANSLAATGLDRVVALLQDQFVQGLTHQRIGTGFAASLVAGTQEQKALVQVAGQYRITIDDHADALGDLADLAANGRSSQFTSGR